MEKKTIIKIIIIALVLALAALILLPNIFVRHSDFYMAPAAYLHLLTRANLLWHNEDLDRNGVHDYWTYDISCFRRLYRNDGITNIAFIPLNLALADAHPADYKGKEIPFGPDLLIESVALTPCPKSGYWFRMMQTDENGVTYNQNPVGSNRILATNINKFAIVAYPDYYGYQGLATFIINEKDVAYAIDSGSDKDKIILQWPDKDPTKTKGPNGKYWEIVE